MCHKWSHHNSDTGGCFSPYFWHMFRTCIQNMPISVSTLYHPTLTSLPSGDLTSHRHQHFYCSLDGFAKMTYVSFVYKCSCQSIHVVIVHCTVLSPHSPTWPHYFKHFWIDCGQTSLLILHACAFQYSYASSCGIWHPTQMTPPVFYGVNFLQTSHTWSSYSLTCHV